MSQSSPTFSVVIPTRDRPQKLAVCLESLAKQDYPRDRFEVIVVDDASELPLDPVAVIFRERLTLTLLRQSRRAGPSVARNCGAAHAKGEFLAFTDDDCSPASDWLQRLAARFASTPRHLIGGRVVNALTDNLYSTATHVILDAIYDYYDPLKGRAHFFLTSNFSLATDLFRQLRGFDENWPLAAAEDREFCYRWLKRGFPMTYAPEASVYHHHDLTLSSFCALHFKYGRGAYHYHLLRASNPGQGGLKPDWNFFLSTFCYPIRHMPKYKVAVVVGLLFVWQVFNAAGYFWQQLHQAIKRTSLCI
jgi:glycosyltransferase involved in cell wall biosynthesis